MVYSMRSKIDLQTLTVVHLQCIAFKTSGQHEAMLQQLGWTKYDFDTGIHEEAVTDAFAAYENLLKSELSTGEQNVTALTLTLSMHLHSRTIIHALCKCTFQCKCLTGVMDRVSACQVCLLYCCACIYSIGSSMHHIMCMQCSVAGALSNTLHCNLD